VAQLNAAEIVVRLEANDLEVGILSAPGRVSRTLRTVHEFEDAFTLVVPATASIEGLALNSRRQRERWAGQQTWIVPGEDSHTGQRLRGWMKAHGWGKAAAMESDNFDLILQLVSLGLGVAFVPVRSLASFARKHTLRRVQLKQRFERRLVVLTRRHRKTPAYLERFVANILF
jgi:DNA-binding transcriptional LysR family regulator